MRGGGGGGGGGRVKWPSLCISNETIFEVSWHHSTFYAHLVDILVYRTFPLSLSSGKEDTSHEDCHPCA